MAGGSCCASLQTSREHRGRGPERNEQGRRGGRLAPPQLRRTPPPRAQAEGILRQRPPHGGDWEGGAVIKYLPLSQRERWRLCEAWTNRRRQASGRLPASHLSPRRNFLGGQKCAYCSLHARISTWPQVCLHHPPPHPQTPWGLSSPLFQGHLRLQSLGFRFRQWSQGSTEDQEQQRETGQSRPGVLF